MRTLAANEITLVGFRLDGGGGRSEGGARAEASCTGIVGWDRGEAPVGRYFVHEENPPDQAVHYNPTFRPHPYAYDYGFVSRAMELQACYLRQRTYRMNSDNSE
ncbi:hypothetical protein GWI33_003092 [Rhynchophorus ferrugineus]|uniref:Uncharacterized protein n=1 Tax=Rhynchophorus ferrugineus TaxID=354439 RepID=A0A834INW3_RHYFE|nr:hypothetical protein GWI33_003092 [Rhynchophorus ferrugineus]